MKIINASKRTTSNGRKGERIIYIRLSTGTRTSLGRPPLGYALSGVLYGKFSQKR
jgi:hypothetical protein